MKDKGKVYRKRKERGDWREERKGKKRKERR